ncbi:hypothetical protein IV417_11350 [Alphaproteobacteria bacterium KMM 3653]|uniref:NfeD-like C-terminal domain-containing protein n=1 Tax=Harenicola maris TaxID=2841044 RepID=A0AAP2G4J5_9RHOB|nr:hypothetical protein [Harenicola maris]
MSELLLTNWWVWIAGALVLGILEVFAPGFIFLGFAVGAFLTGLLVAWGPGFAAGLMGSVAGLVVVFAVISLIAWIVMRASFGGRGAQVKTFDRDIND